MAGLAGLRERLAPRDRRDDPTCLYLGRVRVPLGGLLIVTPGGAAFTLCPLFSFFRAAFTLLRCLSMLCRDLALGLGIVILGFGAAV